MLHYSIVYYSLHNVIYQKFSQLRVSSCSVVSCRDQRFGAGCQCEVCERTETMAVSIGHCSTTVLGNLVHAGEILDGHHLLRKPQSFYSERGILYYSTPREESFTILLRERNPLLFYSEVKPRGVPRLRLARSSNAKRATSVNVPLSSLRVLVFLLLQLWCEGFQQHKTCMLMPLNLAC